MVLVKVEKDLKAGEILQLNHPDVFRAKDCVAEKYACREDGEIILSVTRTKNETVGLMAQHKDIVKDIDTYEEE